MKYQTYDEWFCSLQVKQKEHVACKVLIKEGKDTKQGIYPNCVNIWLPLDNETKARIYAHCTDKHGMWIQEGGDGHIYSY